MYACSILGTEISSLAEIAGVNKSVVDSTSFAHTQFDYMTCSP